jgi:hypothetical protein
VTGDPKSVWLLDTFTGSLSHCEFQAVNKQPLCSPWALAPGDSPAYRYDPAAQKLVPMNDAARRKDAESKSSK